MGWLKKATRKVKKSFKKIGRKVLPMATMGMYQPKEKDAEMPEDIGQRGEAAKRLAETSKQAGGGQIKYQTEEDVMT